MHAGVGRKGIYLYNLPETVSAYKYLGVPSVSARFGTDPFFWNWAMWLTARLLPRSLLNDREFVKKFAALSDPFVRAVDKWAGEAVVSWPLECAARHTNLSLRSTIEYTRVLYMRGG